MRRIPSIVSSAILSVVVGIGITSFASGSPASAQAPGIAETPPEAQIVLSGRVDVPLGTRAGEIVIFHGPAHIEGEVEGDVVALDGLVEVSGLVNGDVVALDGTVSVGRTGRVTGDVVSRETAVVQEGGQVDGEVRGVSTYLSSVRVVGKVVWWVPVSISTLVLGLLMLLFFPRAATAVDDAARDRPVISMAWGLAMMGALPAAAVLATVSLAGLALGVGALLSLLLLTLAAYAWSAWILGRLMLPSRRVLAFLAGWLVLRVLALVPLAGGIVLILATMAGLGATSVAIWRARRAPASPIRASAPPPASKLSLGDDLS